MKIKLEDLNFPFVSREEFIPVFSELRPKVFSENNDVDYSIYWSEEELQKNKDLQSKFKSEIRSYLFCKHEDKVVG